MASSYLEQRDGMDPGVARMVIESMDADSVNALIEEANTTVMSRVAVNVNIGNAVANAVIGYMNDGGVAPLAAAGAIIGDVKPDDGGGDDYADFIAIEALATIETFNIESGTPGKADYVTGTFLGFADLAVQTAAAAKMKRESEVRYKALKAVLYKYMNNSGSLKIMMPWGEKLRAYIGHNKSLSATKLIEKGVDPKIVQECYVDSPFEDVSFYPPKGGQ